MHVLLIDSKQCKRCINQSLLTTMPTRIMTVSTMKTTISRWRNGLWVVVNFDFPVLTHPPHAERQRRRAREREKRGTTLVKTVFLLQPVETAFPLSLLSHIRCHQSGQMSSIRLNLEKLCLKVTRNQWFGANFEDIATLVNLLSPNLFANIL